MSAQAVGSVWYRCSDLTPAQAIVALAVADVVNDVHANEFWMTSKALARKVGMHHRSVRDRLGELTDLGWIQVVVAEPGSPIRYRWLGVESDTPGSESLDAGSESHTPPPSSSSNSSNSTERGTAPATRIPLPWQITEEMIQWATTNVPDVDWETASRQFVDYFKASGGRNAVKVDWRAAWQKWMRDEHKGAFR